MPNIPEGFEIFFGPECVRCGMQTPDSQAAFTVGDLVVCRFCEESDPRDAQDGQHC